MPSRRQSALASTASLAMFGTLALAGATPAQAAGPDAATTAVATLFARLSTDFLPDVASSTALSRQLPTLAVTPAESVGLKTAFSDLFEAGGALEDAKSRTDLGDLADYIDGADGGGWAFTAATAAAR